MSRSCSPNSITYEYNSTNCSPFRRTCPKAEHDILSQLKVQVFEKDQNRRNYNTLLAKFNQLQEELARISKIKEKNEIALNNHPSLFLIVSCLKFLLYLYALFPLFPQ